MSLPGRCSGGCSQERKLELVLVAELDELTGFTDRGEERAAELSDAVGRLVARRRPDDGYESEAATARAILATHGQVEPRLRELAAQSIEPVVGWWCPRCGGVDAPQPCLGVCIRTPVRWANAGRARETQARAVALLARTDELLAVLALVAHTRPRPGQEARHSRAVRQRARGALRMS